MSDTLEAVKHVVASQLRLDADRLEPDTRLVEDLGADSLGLVCVTLALETFFEIDISEDEAKQILTIQDAVNSVRSKR